MRFTSPLCRWLPVQVVLLLKWSVATAVTSTGSHHENLEFNTIPHLVNSPEWEPFYDRLLSTPTLHHMFFPQETRQLQATPDELNLLCNQVLDTIPLPDLVETMSAIIDVLVPGQGIENFFLKSLLVDNLKTGLQIVQVCGSCVESIPNLEGHEEYCGSDIYGNDRQHSGLLFIPTQTDSDGTSNTNTILPGTHKGYIFARESRVSITQAPNLLWLGRNDTSPVVWIYMALASSQSVVFLVPHNLGYGKSADLYKAYIIRKGYETSIVPLWYQSQTLVKTLSGGCAALGNAAIVAGYSEGGYSSIVIAQALHQNAGVDIIRVQSGGGPYKVSSAALLGMLQTIRDGNFPQDALSVLGLLAVSYSSTYPHLANFNASQDMLTVTNGTREVLVEALTGAPDLVEIDFLIQDLTRGGTIIDMFRPGFVLAMESFLTDGILDPCSSVPIEVLRDLEMDLACAAMKENDLTILLEEQIEFPVEFCHSPDDTIAVVGNLPNFNSEFLTQVPDVTGDHFEAAETCFLHILQTAIGFSADLVNYPVEPLHDEQCCPGGVSGCTSPSNSTIAPSGNATNDSTTTPSSSSRHSKVIVFQVVSVVLLVISYMFS